MFDKHQPEGNPVDGIHLKVYAKREVTALIQERLLAHKEVDDIPAGAIKKIADDVAESVLSRVAHLVDDHRIVNGERVHIRNLQVGRS